MSQTDIQPITYDVDQAARYIGIGTTLLNELVKAGEIPSFQIGSRRLFYPEALKRYVESLAYQTANTEAR